MARYAFAFVDGQEIVGQMHEHEATARGTAGAAGPEWPALAGGAVLTSREAVARYETPERGPRGWTPAVLVPDTEAEVAEILRFCGRERRPLVISAGRTGLVEAQRPEGEAVLSLERLARPLAFRTGDGEGVDLAGRTTAESAAALLAWWQDAGRPDLEGSSLTVQAGMAVDAANEIVAGVGLRWPIELGSSSAASVGGCVANGSAGANAIRCGTAAHLCAQASGFWADGSAAGPFAGPRWQTVDPLRLAIDATRVDPALGLIGSQGAFGVITRASLRLWKLPAAREGVLLPMPDMPTAMRLLEAAQAAFPGTVEEYEFIGRPALECVLDFLGDAGRLPFPRDRLRPWCVFLQVDGNATEELVERLYGFLSEAGIPDVDIGYAPLPTLKRIRHSITESSNVRMRARGGGRLSFDTAVPRARFGDYLDTLAARLARDFPGVELLAFGHAGVGGAHLHVLGTQERPVAQVKDALVACVLEVTAAYGGTYSAEHGVGPKWADEFRRRTPTEHFARLVAEKRRHDPAGILNPRSFGLVQARGA
ncbi:MAG TPA: FAD-binding oxidoreductase [Nevskiaceae bacterium]